MLGRDIDDNRAQRGRWLSFGGVILFAAVVLKIAQCERRTERLAARGVATCGIERGGERGCVHCDELIAGDWRW